MGDLLKTKKEYNTRVYTNGRFCISLLKETRENLPFAQYGLLRF